MDKNTQENIKQGFKCEICAQYTPKECEGTEPNTCAICMPVLKEEKPTHNEIV